jgi:formylmethanofuran dehydrogenase subunit E
VIDFAELGYMRQGISPDLRRCNNCNLQYYREDIVHDEDDGMICIDCADAKGEDNE